MSPTEHFRGISLTSACAGCTLSTLNSIDCMQSPHHPLYFNASIVFELYCQDSIMERLESLLFKNDINLNAGQFYDPLDPHLRLDNNCQ